jgi:hypothetical protein
MEIAAIGDVSLKCERNYRTSNSRPGRETFVMDLTETARLMEANRLQVFNQRDPARRREIIGRTYAADVRWTDDDGTTVGQDALNTKAEQLLGGPVAGLVFGKKGAVCGTTGLGFMAFELSGVRNSLGPPTRADQSRICNGLSTMPTNVRIHSAAIDPSTGRWSTDSVTRMTVATASSPSCTTGSLRAAPTARIADCGGLMMAENSSVPYIPRFEMQNDPPSISR